MSGTLTQIGENGVDRAIAYYSKKLSNAEQDYTANERELLALVYFLKRFRCYLEDTTFEVFTDNQVFHNFFTKPNMNRREARWLDLLPQFGILKMNLKPGRIHVLGDVLSRAPHVMQKDTLDVNNMNVSVVSLNLDCSKQYEEDQLFWPIVKALLGELPENDVHRDRMQSILPLFRKEKGLLFYRNKVCVPRRSVRDILHLAHDAKVSGHFAYAKTLSRLDGYHWKIKYRDLKAYCQGCMACQQQKDATGKNFTLPTPLDVSLRRWGSLSTDFIVSLPKTRNGFDAIAAWVARLSRRVHFFPSRGTNTAVETAEAFLLTYSSSMAFQTTLSATGTLSLPPNSGPIS